MSSQNQIADYRQDIDKNIRFIFILILLSPCILVISFELQNDTWFLLNSGRYVLENGFPATEPFTIHQGFGFVMQQWLSALIFWLAYSALGAVGLKVVIIMCYFLIVYIIYLLCMLVSENYFFISFCISLLASLIISLTISERPLVFTTLILSIEIYLLESYEAKKHLKYLSAIPILSIIQINMHAAMWPMIFVLLLPYYSCILNESAPAFNLRLLAGLCLP